MYSKLEYVKRGSRFVRNQVLPGKKRISSLMLYATDLCDSACVHCYIWKKRPVKHLPLKQIIGLMQSACITSSTQVGLEGGEFMLHPEADEILEWFSKHHPNFDLLSNCLKPEKLIAAVRKWPPKRLFVSLDGDKDGYQQMRGKDGYDRVIQVIDALQDEVPISVMLTISPYNKPKDALHVIQLCIDRGIDVRIGVYNNIPFFDTKEDAHTPESDQSFFSEKSEEMEQLYEAIGKTQENLDFVKLYSHWKAKNTNLRCYSILDSLIVLPDGSVPICQNLDVSLGNLNDSTLDEIFNSAASQKTQKDYCKNCNGCWINYHRKYDIILYRNFEKVLPRFIVKKLLGDYSWTSKGDERYSGLMK